MNVKTALRNTLISASYASGAPAARNALRRLRGRSVTRIIAFHKVRDPDSFERKVRTICRRFCPVSLQEYLDGGSRSAASVVMTFDDGYESWLRALPILRRHRVPAVFFVNSGYVDATERGAWADFCKRRLGCSPEPSVRWVDLRSLASDPLFTVGGHTMHHVSLGTAEPALAHKEIREDKERIEAALGRPISFFAYPFGDPASLSAAAARFVEEVGYRAAATLMPGANTPSTSPYLLHRDGLDDVSSPFLLNAWLSGAYDPLKAAQVGMCKLRPGRPAP